MPKWKKSIPIGEGSKCPKCRRTMIRYEHSKDWLPKPNQPYYFQWWDRCHRCRHLQHYEEAKVVIVLEENRPFKDIALEVLEDLNKNDPNAQPPGIDLEKDVPF